MDRNTKIVFIHTGYSWYLPYALHQAKFASPDSEIVLIGNGFATEGVRVESLSNFQSGRADEFKKNYRHMSSSSEGFELFCWLRWFYILEYMLKNQVQSILHLDSDVLLYSSIDEIKRIYGDSILECGFLITKQDFDSLQWSACGHISYWSIGVLKEFCEFAGNSFCDKKYLQLYKRKFDWHRAEQKPGGICDMTTLYLFWRENKGRIQNLALNHEGNLFDDNINIDFIKGDDRYVSDLGKKKVEFIKEQPYFVKSNAAKDLVRVHALHFQGTAKKYIRKFYTGGSFKGKRYSDVIFCRKLIGQRINLLRKNSFFSKTCG